MGVGTEVLIVDWPRVEAAAAAPGRPHGGWITTFESFADLPTDWGQVVMEVERRGWGIVGLRC
ncbi:hypothetical protein [Streptomyces sp. NPDC101150]|uniref:hypothetical protein n=1 Tax=Streptomyces sp. NPDC101150 TaxID=3366114 RepID=UPI0038093BCC